MSIRIQDVLFFGAGDCLSMFGTLSWRTSPEEDVAETFARSGSATFIGKAGALESAETDAARVTWLDLDGDGERETPFLLIERAGENLCLQSENLGTTWSAIGTPTRTAGAHTAAGVSLDLIGDNASGAAEGYSQVVAFTGDGSKAISVFVKEGTSPTPSGSEIFLRDTDANADRLQATWTFTDGVPVVTVPTGSEVRAPELLTDGVYRLHLEATGVVAANTNQIEVYPGRKGTVADTGDVYLGGVQAEDVPAPSSYLKTTAATGSREADAFYFDWPWIPTTCTILLDLVQTVDMADAATVLRIGSGTSSETPRVSLESSGSYYRAVHDNGTTDSTALLAAAPAVAERAELLAIIGSDGSVDLEQSIEQAAATEDSDATAVTFGSSWAGERLYVGPGLCRAIKIVRGAASLADMRGLFS